MNETILLLVVGSTVDSAPVCLLVGFSAVHCMG
jgi:hypothetical protein